MDAPSISVIIPTHDRWPLTRRAIESVFAQTVTVAEVIVVDDGSSDGTAEELREIGYEQVDVIRLPNCGGAGRARNVGIDASTSELVAFLDSDDEWLPDYLQTMVAHFDSSPRPLAVCSGQIMRRPGLDDLMIGPSWSDDDVFDRLLSLRTQVGIAIVFDRLAIGEIRFDESLPAMDERDFLIALSRRGQLVCSLDRLYLRHVDDRPRVSEPRNMLQASTMYLNKYQAELGEHPAMLANHYYRLARWYQRLDDGAGVERSLRQASAADPSDRRLRTLAAIARLGPTIATLGLRAFVRLALLKKTVAERVSARSRSVEASRV